MGGGARFLHPPPVALRNQPACVSQRQKQHIREELQQAIKQKEELRAASRALKERLPKGVTSETLDAKIAELEHKQQHEGHSGEEEKALLKRISELNAAKPQYRELADVEGKLKACEDRRAEIQHRLQQCDAVLTDVKAREDAERQVLEQSRSKQADTDLDHPALNVEKKEVGAHSRGQQRLLLLGSAVGWSWARQWAGGDGTCAVVRGRPQYHAQHAAAHLGSRACTCTTPV